MVKETFNRNKPGFSIPPPPSDGMIGFGATVTAGVLNEVKVTFSGQPSSDYYAAIYLTTQFGQGIMSPKRSHFRLLQSTQVPVTPFVIDAKVAYQSRFGVPEEGAKIFCKVFLIDSTTGAKYNAGELSATVLEV